MPDSDDFLAKLHDSGLAGGVLHDGCAPMPRYAELDAEARAEWARRRVGAFVRERLGGDG